MSLERPIERVIDLIAELERVSPTVPVEIWSLDERGTVLRKYIATSVVQVSPSLLPLLGVEDDRPDSGPFPTVVFIQSKINA